MHFKLLKRLNENKTLKNIYFYKFLGLLNQFDKTTII